MTLFETTITLHDFSRPLADRARSREYCGPCQWLAAGAHAGDRATGIAFYAECAARGSDCIEMARHGSRSCLRLEWANDVLPSYSRIANTVGYFCDAADEHGTPDPSGDVYRPIVARLPRGRGYLAGYTMGGAGMVGFLERYVWDTIEDAALAAHDAAERAAEVAREDGAAFWAEIYGECA